MSKNHFVSHFLPFQINTTIFFQITATITQVFFTKWLLAAILDVRKSLSVAFLAISDQYAIFVQMFFTKWLPSAILDVRNSLWITFLAILDQYRFFILDVRKVSISFLPISDRYTTLFIFEIFDKMDHVGHFGCPNFTFDRISGHFRSICNLIFFWKFLTKWLSAAILDVRNSLSIAFLAISDRSAILDFRNSLFRSQSWPFQIDTEFFFPAAILDV